MPRTDDAEPRGDARRALAFGAFVLDPLRAELRRGDAVVPLRPKAFDLLHTLASRPGQVMGKDELLAAVWPGVVVGEDSLAQCVHELRAALGADGADLVRTVPRRGYRFDAKVVQAETAPAAIQPPAQVARRRGRLPLLAGSVIAVLVLALGGYVVAERWAPAGPALQAPRGSVVVLPLEVEPGSEGGTWFSDPLTADLTTDLGRYSGIVVISRDTAFRFKDGSADPREIARQLNVRYVVRGTVQRHDNEVRLNLALVDGATGRQHWGERFVLDRADLRGSLQDVAGVISRTLGVEVWRAEGQRAITLAPGQVEADDLAMRGWAVWFQGLSRENVVEALRWFEAAVARDPNSIRGWAGIGLMNGTAVSSGWAEDVTAARERQREAIRQMERIDRNDLFTQLARIGLYYMRQDFAGLLELAQGLVQRFPNMPHAHHQQASALMMLGRFDECVEPIGRAIRLGPRDPMLPYWHSVLSFCHFFSERYAAAEAAARLAVEANTALAGPPLLLTAALARNGKVDDAKKLMAEWQRHAAFKARTLELVLLGDEPRLAEGRERIIATLRELGVP